MQNYVLRGYDKWYAVEQLTGILIAVAHYPNGGDNDDNDNGYDEANSNHYMARPRPRPRPEHSNVKIYSKHCICYHLAFTLEFVDTKVSHT